MAKKIYMKAKQKYKIKIIRDNVSCKIINLYNKDIVDKIDRSLSYYLNGYRFTPGFKSGRWDGRNRLLKKKGEDYIFLSGLLPRVESILKNNDQEYEVIDDRKDIEVGKKIKIKNMEPRKYQEEAIASAIKHGHGIIKIATGGGKTAVMAGIVSNLNVKTLIFVPGIDLMYQTRGALEHFLCNTKVGIIGDGEVDIKKITVCTIWSCVNALEKVYEKFGEEDYTKKEKFDLKNKEKIKKTITSADLFIVDECQFLGTSTLQHINYACHSARFRLGLSATAYREDNADLLLEGATGETIFEATASQLINDGFLIKPTIHFIDVPEIDSLKGNYQSVYKQYIVENDIRNDKIVNSANKLAENGHKVLVLIKNIRHGEILLEKFGSKSVVHFVRGELQSDERNKIKDCFTRGEFQILIASSIYDQGIDIPSLDSLILACGGKSMGKLFQRVGRILRPCDEKNKAIVVDFIDNEPRFLRKHSMKRLDIYRKEPGFSIKLPKGKSNGKTKKKTKQLPEEEGW